jgi:hypothetical protein
MPTLRKEGVSGWVALRSGSGTGQFEIGWCIESHEREQLHAALRLIHAFAGGRFNPVIPVDAPELGENLVDNFASIYPRIGCAAYSRIGCAAPGPSLLPLRIDELPSS